MFDVIVVGAGPTGIAAALRARELGARVALVERNRLGGTCTNDGCVPTRVLAHAARLVREARQCAEYGVWVSDPSVDFPRLMERTRAIVDEVRHAKQGPDQLAGDRLAVLRGDARFLDPHALMVGDQSVRGESIILCVGGHARRLTVPGGELAITSSDVWRMTRLPRSVAIVGASATGCQLASIFRTFGAEVTLLDLAPRPMGNTDRFIGDAVAQAFARAGIRVVMNIAGCERIDRAGDNLRVSYAREGQQHALDAQTVIAAVGWPGNVENLALDAAGVKVERGRPVVNDALRTNVPHIFAAGDVTGRSMLVESGSYEGRIAAANAVLGHNRSARHTIVPHGGFTDPEYGAVGLTEEQAAAEHDIAVAVVPYTALDRARIDGRAEGACKLIVSRESLEVLGAHVVGEQAVEVVQAVAAAMGAAARVDQLARVEWAYPTFTAVIGIAARKVLREMEVLRDQLDGAFGH